MPPTSLEARLDVSHRPSLDTLSDAELHAAARRLTAASNVTLVDLLAHLGEVESRGIYRNRACASLYTYCIYELRMSEDAAFRRSKAARLVHQHPELRDVVARGELHLTGLLMVAPYLGGERHTEILERARFRTKREIARLIAEIDPSPAVAARIVPIAPAPAGAATHRALVETLAGPVRDLPTGDRPEDWVEPRREPDLDAADCALDVTRESRQAAAPERPMSYEVRFTASQEYVDLLDEALGLLGEPRKAARLPEVQLRALRELVERLRRRRTGRRRAVGRKTGANGDEPRRDAPGPAPERHRVANGHAGRSDAPEPAPERESAADRDEPRSDAPEPAPERRTRYVPVAVRRAVWDRDASRCAYVDERGRRCQETHRLEVHHVCAFALGGPHTVDNLELRCRAHNELAAEEDFGRATMRWMRGATASTASRGRLRRAAHPNSSPDESDPCTSRRCHSASSHRSTSRHRR